MEQSQEKLDTLIEKSVLGYDQVEAFTPKRNEIQVEESRNRCYGRACIGSAGEDFQGYVHMALKFIVIAIDRGTL